MCQGDEPRAPKQDGDPKVWIHKAFHMVTSCQEAPELLAVPWTLMRKNKDQMVWREQKHI